MSKTRYGVLQCEALERGLDVLSLVRQLDKLETPSVALREVFQHVVLYRLARADRHYMHSHSAIQACLDGTHDRICAAIRSDDHLPANSVPNPTPDRTCSSGRLPALSRRLFDV